MTTEPPAPPPPSTPPGRPQAVTVVIVALLLGIAVALAAAWTVFHDEFTYRERAFTDRDPAREEVYPDAVGALSTWLQGKGLQPFDAAVKVPFLHAEVTGNGRDVRWFRGPTSGLPSPIVWIETPDLRNNTIAVTVYWKHRTFSWFAGGRMEEAESIRKEIQDWWRGYKERRGIISRTDWHS